jgi:hypothetical protein
MPIAWAIRLVKVATLATPQQKKSAITKKQKPMKSIHFYALHHCIYAVHYSHKSH